MCCSDSVHTPSVAVYPAGFFSSLSNAGRLIFKRVLTCTPHSGINWGRTTVYQLISVRPQLLSGNLQSSAQAECNQGIHLVTGFGLSRGRGHCPWKFTESGAAMRARSAISRTNRSICFEEYRRACSSCPSLVLPMTRPVGS